MGREPDGNLNSRVTFPWWLGKCRRVALARPHEHCQLSQRGVERPPPRLPDKPPRINRVCVINPNGYQGPDLDGTLLAVPLDPSVGESAWVNPYIMPAVAQQAQAPDQMSHRSARREQGAILADQDAVAGVATFRVTCSTNDRQNWSFPVHQPSPMRQSGHSGGLGPQPVRVDPPLRDGADGEPWLRRFAQGIIAGRGPDHRLTTA